MRKTKGIIIALVIMLIMIASKVDACVLSYQEYTEEKIRHAYVVGEYILDAYNNTPNLEDFATAARSIKADEEVYVYDMVYLESVDMFYYLNMFEDNSLVMGSENFPFVDVTYYYKSHVSENDYKLYTCVNEEMEVKYLTLTSVGESTYKTSATRGIQLTSNAGISEVRYCFTSESECVPNQKKEIPNQDVVNIELEYPDSSSSTHVCVETRDNSNKTSGIVCDTTYMYVDSKQIEIVDKTSENTVKEGTPQAVSELFDITYPVSGGKVYYYYYDAANKKNLLTSISDLPSGNNTIEVIGRSGNGLVNSVQKDIRVEKYKVKYEGIEEEDQKAYGEYADLGKEAEKNGYEFIGWNRDKFAKYAEEKIIVTEDMTLYPIFKREIKVSFEVKNEYASVEYREISCEIMNEETECEVRVPKIDGKIGYTALGFSKDKESHEAEIGESIKVSEDTTVYGITKKNTAQTATIYYYDNEIKSKILKCYLYNGENECEVNLSEIEAGSYKGKELKGYTKSKEEIEKVENGKITSGVFYYAYYEDIYKASLYDEIGERELEEKVTYIISEDEIKTLKEDIELPEIRAKEGYEVEGWNEVGNIGSAEYHEGDIIQINENTEYEAIYKKKIKVSYESADTLNVPNPSEGYMYYGSKSKSIKEAEIVLDTGIGMEKKDAISGAKYTFSTWVKENTRYYAGEKIKVIEDVTVKADWILNGCIVNFDYSYNGGTSADVASIALYGAGSTIDLSDIKAIKPGWLFIGWSENPNSHEGGLTKYTLTSEEISEVTLYAMYEKEINIKYEVQDKGVFSIVNSNTSAYLYNNETETKVTMPSIVKNTGYEGYEVVGWNTSKEATDALVVSGGEINVSKDTTFYTITRNTKPIKMTYVYSKNGSVAKKEVECMRYNGSSSCQTEANIEDEYEGKKITGWSSRSDKVEETSEIINGEAKVYAIYKDIVSVTYYSYKEMGSTVTKTYEINYLTNETGVVNQGNKVELENPGGLDGYEAIGWRKDTLALEAEYESYSEYNITETCVFYGIYKRNIELTYGANGGSTTPEKQIKTVIYNTALKLEEVEATFKLDKGTTRTGYTLEGWSETLNGETVYKEEITIKNNTKVYAVWKAANFNVIYDYGTNGGSNATRSQSVTYLTNIPLPEDGEKEGYVFVGWNTNKDAKEGLTEIEMPSKDITIYAIYKQEVKATWILVDNAAGSVKEESTTCNKYNKEEVCTIETGSINLNSGYQAIGWSTTNGSITSSVGIDVFTEIGRDTTYYSITKKEQELKGTFHYINNGVVNTETTSCGLYNGATSCQLESPITPVPYNGVSFASWSSSGTSNVSTTLEISGNKDFYGYYVQVFSVTKIEGASATTTTNTYLYEYIAGTNIVTKEPTVNIGTPESISGYETLGWREDDTKGVATLASNKEMTLTKSLTLNGVYKRTITLSYETNGGSAITSENATQYYNSSSGASEHSFTVGTTNKEGYTLQNYGLGSTSGTKYTAGSTITITESSKLYANWKVNNYTATITGSNVTISSSSVSVPYGGTATFTVTPTSGYYLNSITCTNGYTVSGYTTGTSATGTQTVTIKNPSTTQATTCTVGIVSLCPYTAGQTWTYNYTGGVQSFTVPCNGTYKLEVWGGQGANDVDSNTNKNKGGYATGSKTLTKEQNIYICVGGAGGSPGWTTNTVRAYNGGGRAGNNTGNGGGGATHMATTNRGVLSNYNSYRSEVLIVAGGGGGAGDSSWGGPGGGTSGLNGAGASGATGTSGYAFGQGQDAWNDQAQGGGGGWYGGYATSSMSGAGGGSGYIGGVSGGSMSNGIQSGNGYARITLVTIDYS